MSDRTVPLTRFSVPLPRLGRILDVLGKMLLLLSGLFMTGSVVAVVAGKFVMLLLAAVIYAVGMSLCGLVLMAIAGLIDLLLTIEACSRV